MTKLYVKTPHGVLSIHWKNGDNSPPDFDGDQSAIEYSKNICMFLTETGLIDGVLSLDLLTPKVTRKLFNLPDKLLVLDESEFRRLYREGKVKFSIELNNYTHDIENIIENHKKGFLLDGFSNEIAVIDTYAVAIKKHESEVDRVQSIVANLYEQCDLLDQGEKQCFDNFLFCADAALYDLQGVLDEKIAAALIRFYLLGVKAGELSDPYRNWDVSRITQQLLDLHVSDTNRRKELSKRNAKKAIAKSHVQYLASLYWAKPEFATVRVAEMADKIWEYIHCQTHEAFTLVKENLPDNSRGLIDWLREVAPEAARKGGRPSKESKTAKLKLADAR